MPDWNLWPAVAAPEPRPFETSRDPACDPAAAEESGGPTPTGADGAAEPSALARRAARAFAALRHRSFRLFWAGQLVSLTGGWMHQTALQWLVFRLTGSAASLGLVGFAANIPVLVLGFPSGVLVDRLDRRRIVLWSMVGQMALALLIAWLTFSGLVRFEHVIVLAVAVGVLSALEVPARQTLFMDLVGRADLMSAIALNSTAFAATRVVGPSLAGLLLSRISEGACFLVNGVSFLAIVLALVAIGRMPARERSERPCGKDPQHPPPEAAPSGAPPPAGLTGATEATEGVGSGGLWEGVRHVAAQPVMRRLILMVALANLCAIPYIQLLPVYVARVLHRGPEVLGLFSGCVGLGALAGGLLAASRPRSGLSPRLAWRGFLGLSVFLLGFAVSGGLASGMALLAAIGFSVATQMATTNNYLQVHAPERLRGRVVAVYTTTFIGLFPIGSLALGWLAEAHGVQAALASGALACLIAALAVYPTLPAAPAQ
jgi:MFS family permease